MLVSLVVVDHGVYVVDCSGVRASSVEFGCVVGREPQAAAAVRVRLLAREVGVLLLLHLLCVPFLLVIDSRLLPPLRFS